jgi:hypothetical protein
MRLLIYRGTIDPNRERFGQHRDERHRSDRWHLSWRTPQHQVGPTISKCGYDLARLVRLDATVPDHRYATTIGAQFRLSRPPRHERRKVAVARHRGTPRVQVHDKRRTSLQRTAQRRNEAQHKIYR